MQNEKAGLTFTSPPYWVGKEYESQTSEEEISAFIEKMCGVMDAVTRRDESRVVINTGTGFTTALDKKAKRHVLLLIDQWTNQLRSRGWNLRHVRHWLFELLTASTCPPQAGAVSALMWGLLNLAVWYKIWSIEYLRWDEQKRRSQLR